MSSVKWSPMALRDVRRLYRFLFPKNPHAAKRAAKAIQQGVQISTRQPGIGRPVEDMPEHFRDWLIDFGDSGYVARYRVDADGVTVLAIWHQREAGL
jgi:plasmid stabilization system protein ParE